MAQDDTNVAPATETASFINSGKEDGAVAVSYTHLHQRQQQTSQEFHWKFVDLLQMFHQLFQDTHSNTSNFFQM